MTTDKGIKWTFRRFADDPKLGGAVDTPKEQEAIKKDLDRLEKWDRGNLRSFNSTKFNVLHLSWGNSQYEA